MLNTMMISFEDRQKTKILRTLEKENQTYAQIERKTGIVIESIRGRMSLIRKKGLVEKVGEEHFKITDDGVKYLVDEK